jgi:hypothetical protein
LRRRSLLRGAGAAQVAPAPGVGHLDVTRHHLRVRGSCDNEWPASPGSRG